MTGLDLETYRLRAQAAYSPATVEKRLIILRRYAEFLRERGLEPGAESLMLWLDELQRSGYSPATVSAYAHAVLSYFELMLVPIDERALRAVRRRLPPLGAGQVDYLTEEEVARLLQAAPPHRKLIYALMYAYARRLGEVLSLTWRDVDLERGTITFTILKRRRPERATYALEPWIAEMIRAYRHLLGAERLFPLTERAVERAFKRDCARAGIEPRGRRLRPHVLRHSRATSLAARGVPIDVVSKHVLRHSKLETTVRFYRAVTEEEVRRIPSAGEVLEQAARGLRE